MTTIYLAVDEDRTEACFNGEPHRITSDPIPGYWNDFDRVELPPGTIEKLTGRKITWKDEPIEYSGERELTKSEAKAMHSALYKSVNIKANGRRNTGNRNTGDWNTGNRNTGNRNTGHWNTGNLNTGNRNTGYLNTGNRNTGYLNTGSWNTANNHVGCFNTRSAEKALYFNKECFIKEWEKAQKPSFLFAPSPTTWVNKDDMTAEEKEEHTLFETTGGYLRKNNMKEEWRKAWDGASDKDRELLFKLPNFDADVFIEITGIDVRKQEVEEMTLEQVCQELGRTVKIVK